jgi:hypothetical protein
MVEASIDYTRVRSIVGPGPVIVETQKVCKAQDSVQAFLDNDCVLDMNGAITPADLLAAYTKYAARNKMTTVSGGALKAALVARGLKIVRRKNHGVKGPRQWIGLSLVYSMFEI